MTPSAAFSYPGGAVPRRSPKNDQIYNEGTVMLSGGGRRGVEYKQVSRINVRESSWIERARTASEKKEKNIFFVWYMSDDDIPKVNLRKQTPPTGNIQRFNKRASAKRIKESINPLNFNEVAIYDHSEKGPFIKYSRERESDRKGTYYGEKSLNQMNLTLHNLNLNQSAVIEKLKNWIQFTIKNQE
jgi:hypothetical protein